MTHWRLCKHKDAEILGSGMFFDISECECGVREIQLKHNWPWPIKSLFCAWGRWKLSRFFHENINWWPAEEF